MLLGERSGEEKLAHEREEDLESQIKALRTELDTTRQKFDEKEEAYVQEIEVQPSVI